MLPNRFANRSRQSAGESLNPACAPVIHIKERNFEMLKKDLILRNPLRLLGTESHEALPAGGFGAVLARAGVGKTALMVQLALNSLLRDQNVLHISLNDPVRKVSLWYEEVFRHIAAQYDDVQIRRLRESILTHRFIMTFQAGGFSVPVLQERLTEFAEQGIFIPRMVLIDGLPFDPSTHPMLLELKELAKSENFHVWLSVRTHRRKNAAKQDLPSQFLPVADLFEAAIALMPEGNAIHIMALKGGTRDSNQPSLLLDPASMLIKKA